MEYSLHFHQSSYSTCKIFILLTFATSRGAEVFYNICSKKGSSHLSTAITTLHTAERCAVMWLMELESACVRRKVIFPMAQDVFIRSRIQVSQSNGITSSHTQWCSLQVHRLILVTMFAPVTQQTELELLLYVILWLGISFLNVPNANDMQAHVLFSGAE